MNHEKLTLQDLNAAIEDIGSRFPNLSDDDRFVLWFFRAYVTESEERAAEAVAGGSRDKGIDGLLIDDAARVVFLVQAKYRKKLASTTEKRDDVISFASTASQVWNGDARVFQQFTANMEPYSANLLKDARKRVTQQNYRVMTYFVTLGKLSASTRRDAEQIVRKARCDARVEFIDGARAMVLFRDYLDGVAPPIPTLDLEMEKSANVTVNGVSQRYDDLNKIESWVFSMCGDAVATLFDFAGPRIFARNIRGYLGAGTDVNRNMVATLKSEPGKFFYYNNGITIICDEAEKKSRQGKDILQVSNPQIINGQQTTRTLAAHATDARNASVLVKVIRVPRRPDGGSNGFEALVSRIVAGTNWQNKITASDLMSNDRIQIELERSFRKLGYLYIRKRQSKGEARRSAPGKHYRPIKKDEIAQAVAACEMDPAIVRKGKEELFEESSYPKVFPNTDPNFYLARYALRREVAYCARSDRELRYAQWHTLHFVWSRLAPMVRATRKARAFRQLWERQREMVSDLSEAIGTAFDVMLRYYRHNAGAGASAVDVSVFFKQTGHHHRFLTFWDSTTWGKAAFEKCMARVQAAIEAFDE
ncbi:MAG: AIPR family protein [Phycisphaerae bacterium]|jgi:hypothetical protein